MIDITALQAQAPWLAVPMTLFSIFGQPEFFVLAITLIYWCKNSRLAIRLALLLGISGGISSALKILFHLPRPYWVSPDVQAFASHSSFAFPSGHTLGAVVFFGLLAAYVRRRWFTLAAVLLIVSVGVSRIFLGAHFPSDVLAGAGIGIIILAGFFALEEPAGRRIVTLPTSRQILIAFAGSIVLIFISSAALAVIGDWQVPLVWAEVASQQSGQPIDPLGLKNAMTAAGFLFGFAAGAVVARRRRMEWPADLFCSVFGLAVAWILWFLPGLVMPAEPDLLAYFLLYLRAVTVAVWISYGAPAIFART